MFSTQGRLGQFSSTGKGKPMGRAPRLAGENCMPISSRPALLRPIVREFILGQQLEPSKELQLLNGR